MAKKYAMLTSALLSAGLELFGHYLLDNSLSDPHKKASTFVFLELERDQSCPQFPFILARICL